MCNCPFGFLARARKSLADADNFRQRYDQTGDCHGQPKAVSKSNAAAATPASAIAAATTSIKVIRMGNASGVLDGVALGLAQNQQPQRDATSLGVAGHSSSASSQLNAGELIVASTNATAVAARNDHPPTTSCRNRL
jgi:hypothetical protein